MVWMPLTSSFSPGTPHICSSCTRHLVVPMCHSGSPGDVACPALTWCFTMLSTDPLCMSQGPSKYRWKFEANWIKAQFIRELGFPDSSVVKNPPVNAGDTGLILESGRSPIEGNSGKKFPTCILAWEIPQTEEPGRLQSMRSQRVGHNFLSKPQEH